MTWQHVAYNRLYAYIIQKDVVISPWVYDQLTLEVLHPRTLQKPTVWSWQLLGQHGRSYGELCRLEQKHQNHWQRKLGLIQGLNLWNLTPALHTSNISHMAQAFQALRVPKHPTLPASAMGSCCSGDDEDVRPSLKRKRWPRLLVGWLTLCRLEAMCRYSTFCRMAGALAMRQNVEYLRTVAWTKTLYRSIKKNLWTSAQHSRHKYHVQQIQWYSFASSDGNNFMLSHSCSPEQRDS